MYKLKVLKGVVEKEKEKEFDHVHTLELFLKSQYGVSCFDFDEKEKGIKWVKYCGNRGVLVLTKID